MNSRGFRNTPKTRHSEANAEESRRKKLVKKLCLVQFFKKLCLTQFFLIITLFPLAVFAAAGPAESIESQSKLKSYDLQIPIGEFSNISAQDFASGKAVPRYISNLYKWLVGFTLILGVIALMLGGVVWLIAGGDKGRVDKAKGIIKNSLVGIFLALGSYLLLWTISPNLVQLRPIQVSQSRGIKIEFKEKVPEYKKVTDPCKECRGERSLKFTTHYCYQDKECMERIKKDKGPCANTIECVVGLQCNPTTKKCEDNPTNPLGLCCNIMKNEVVGSDGSAIGSAIYSLAAAISGGKIRLEDCININAPEDIGIKSEDTDFTLQSGQKYRRSFLPGKKQFCILACPTVELNGNWEQPINPIRGCSVPSTRSSLGL